MVGNHGMYCTFIQVRASESVGCSHILARTRLVATEWAICRLKCTKHTRTIKRLSVVLSVCYKEAGPVAVRAICLSSQAAEAERHTPPKQPTSDTLSHREGLPSNTHHHCIHTTKHDIGVSQLAAACHCIHTGSRNPNLSKATTRLANPVDN